MSQPHMHGGHELPPEQFRLLQKATRVEWFSLVYFATAIAFTALVMGQSQAMKTAWIDDLLGCIPPLSMLIAARLCSREPTLDYPYGYHRSINIAFLAAAVALLGLGVWLVFENVHSLVSGARPTIAGVTFLGREVWLGWLMIAALLWSTIPTIFLGRIKGRLARPLHDKALHADADMNRADWLTGVAAILGVLGIGLGYWWADAVAAIIIAIDIVHDGFANLRTVVGDLMDRRPYHVDGRPETIPTDLEQALERLPWVLDATVRLRENGHIFIGEVFIQTLDELEPHRRSHEVRTLARALDWRLQDITVQLIGLPESADTDTSHAAQASHARPSA